MKTKLMLLITALAPATVCATFSAAAPLATLTSLTSLKKTVGADLTDFKKTVGKDAALRAEFGVSAFIERGDPLHAPWVAAKRANDTATLKRIYAIIAAREKIKN